MFDRTGDLPPVSSFLLIPQEPDPGQAEVLSQTLCLGLPWQGRAAGTQVVELAPAVYQRYTLVGS